MGFLIYSPGALVLTLLKVAIDKIFKYGSIRSLELKYPKTIKTGSMAKIAKAYILWINENKKIE